MQCRRHWRHGFNPWVRKIPCRRKWQPPSFLAWEIPWSLVGYSPKDGKEWDKTEWLSTHAWLWPSRSFSETQLQYGGDDQYLPPGPSDWPPVFSISLMVIHSLSCSGPKPRVILNSSPLSPVRPFRSLPPSPGSTITSPLIFLSPPWATEVCFPRLSQLVASPVENYSVSFPNI